MADDTRGFPGLPCPSCNDTGSVQVSLDDTERLYCTSCDNDFTLANVENLIALWAPAVAWLRSAPRSAPGAPPAGRRNEYGYPALAEIDGETA